VRGSEPALRICTYLPSRNREEAVVPISFTSPLELHLEPNLDVSRIVCLRSDLSEGSAWPVMSPPYFEIVVAAEMNADELVRVWPLALHPFPQP
jgi:hypothetical protein